MGNRKKTKFSKNDVISASEIGQYYFCSNAWFLQKCGFKPVSPQLDIGLKKHKTLGKIISSTEKEIKKSNIFLIFGIILLIISLLLLFFEVVL